MKAEEWATEVFKDSDLGDPRRTRRLVKLASNYAKNIGSSTVKSCGGNESEVEASYRFLRNDKVSPEAIRTGGFISTSREACKAETLLALEDTTTLSYTHQAASQLGYTSNSPSAKSQGFQVHSILLLSQESGRSLGLIEQSWYCRDKDSYGKSKEKGKRAYADKESYKWEHASRNMLDRLGPKMQDVISVCDREADIYDYLHYKLTQGQRFIVRARENRKTKTQGDKLFEQVFHRPLLGTYKVQVQQRGGRKARLAVIQYYSASVEVVLPKHQRHKGYPPTLQVNVVGAKEVKKDGAQAPLEWVILTSEPVNTAELARKVLRNYELRWRIEDYHKAWKSGVGVEELRLQSKENLERAGSILAFIAVKLLQMREIALCCPDELQQTIPATHLLTDDEWRVLWVTTKKSKPPKKPPDLKWAYQSLGKLGGWHDSKRTGIVGWNTLWKGWFRLMDKVESYLDAKIYF
jgi:hypothetical protein